MQVSKLEWQVKIMQLSVGVCGLVRRRLVSRPLTGNPDQSR